METFEKKQKNACVDLPADTILSYEYDQSGFTIDLMKQSVLFFNNILNNTFICSYSSIREINYSLPDCKSDDAELCIMTDDILNPVWTFRFSSDTDDICEQWLNTFNNHIFLC